MSEFRLRRRQRLRRKEVEALSSKIRETLGANLFSADDPVETGDAGGYEVALVRGHALAIFIEGEPFPTVRGFLNLKTDKRYVTVDMGAVRFLANGADVMAPGVVDADPEIAKGMPVWVRDQKNLQPLVVGTALMSGPEMVVAKEGKAVKTINYVGDKLWNLSA